MEASCVSEQWRRESEARLNSIERVNYEDVDLSVRCRTSSQRSVLTVVVAMGRLAAI